MEFLNETFLTAAGAVVLAIGGFALMRMRRHSIIEAACFAGGVLGMIGVLDKNDSVLIKALQRRRLRNMSFYDQL